MSTTGLTVTNLLPLAVAGRPDWPALSFHLPLGGCLAVMGPSGRGKSLVLRALADLDPHHGDVCWHGESQASLPAPLWRSRVVYVAAESGWWADSVKEHFADPIAARALLSAILLPPEALDWPVNRLSTGERQRLALLRAFTLPSSPTTPRLYLLDEPTAALDPQATAAVEALCQHQRQQGATLLFVTHHTAQAERLGASIFTL